MNRENMGAMARGTQEYLAEQNNVEQGARLMMNDIRRNLPQVEEAEALDAAQVNQLLGMVRYGQFLDSVNKVTMLKALQQLKERKAYRGMMVQAGDDQAITIKTWDQLCRYIGRSPQQVDEDLKNLAMFGDNLISRQNDMGVGYRDLRKMRGIMQTLTDTEKMEVQELVDTAAKSNDPDSIFQCIETLGARTKAAEDAAKAAKADAEDARKAKNVYLDEKIKAEDELRRFKNPRTEDERAEIMRLRRVNLFKEAQDVTRQIMGLSIKLANMVNANPMLDSDPIIDGETMDMLNREASQMCQIVRDNLLKGGFDVDFAAEYGEDPMSLPEDDEA